MTAEQILGSVLIAVVAAVVTAFANNFWESRRLRNTWERETKERVALYRRQRMEQHLDPIQDYLMDAIQTSHTILMDMFDKELRHDALRRVWQKRAGAAAAGTAADDNVLVEKANEFIATEGELTSMVLTMIREETALDTTPPEYQSLESQLHIVARSVRRRVEELIEEAYAEALAEA
jgi:hypothetical protein